MKLSKEQLRALAAQLNREVFEPLRVKERSEQVQAQQKARELTKDELEILKRHKKSVKELNELYKKQYKLAYPSSVIGNNWIETQGETAIKNLLKINPSTPFKTTLPTSQQILDDLIVGTIDAKDTGELIEVIKKKYKVK